MSLVWNKFMLIIRCVPFVLSTRDTVAKIANFLRLKIFNFSGAVLMLMKKVSKRIISINAFQENFVEKKSIKR